jgi:hypothetical protein
VFENRVLRRIFGCKRGEVAGGWRRLHTEGLHNLYASPNIIRVIKARRMRWISHMGVMRNAYKILVGKPEGRDHAEDLGIDGDNIRMNLREIGWEMWTRFIWLLIRTSVGLL